MLWSNLPVHYFDRKYQMPAIPLDNWSIIGVPPTSYAEPRRCLRGQLVGDSTYISTSEIKSVAGNEVTTANGTVYQLKIPHPDYM